MYRLKISKVYLVNRYNLQNEKYNIGTGNHS